MNLQNLHLISELPKLWPLKQMNQIRGLYSAARRSLEMAPGAWTVLKAQSEAESSFGSSNHKNISEMQQGNWE